MVKVKAELEPRQDEASHKSLNHISNPMTQNINNNNRILKPCNNQNHLHHHRIYHHYTYYYHYSIDQISDNGLLSSGAGAEDTTASAPKFYFGPGFEPQQSAPISGGCAIHGVTNRNSSVNGDAEAKSSEYVVLFHVNPGVTISFQVGETTEILRGPVTVPMVSTNASPPIAMPVTVPAGHVVQQIVDESGTLRHVILSPQHPAGLVSIPQNYANETNGTSNQRHYTNIPPPPHPNYASQHLHTQIPPPSLQSGSSSPQSHSSSCGGGGMGAHSPPPPQPPPPQTYCKDERAQRQHYKLKKKLYDKQIKGDPPNQGDAGSNVNNNNNNNNSGGGGGSGNVAYLAQTKLLMCANNRSKMGGSGALKTAGNNSVETSEDGEESSVQDDEDAVRLITEILSSIEAPLVLDLGPRSALLQWAPPTRLNEASENPETTEMSESDLVYEVLLSDKSKEMKFKSIYRGGSLSCRIRDLRPGQEYSVCVQVHHGELQGSATDPIVKFTTPSCEPDKPPAPKLIHRTKNSLQIRWNAANDNGSPIQSYVVEIDDGAGGEFVEVYRSRSKQHTVQKLRPSTGYRVRMCATNEVGKGPYSDVMTFFTSDNPPAQPHAPVLVEATPTTLHLQWNRRFRDDEFTLQLDDPRNAYGFMNIYNGPDTHYMCNRLHYYTSYKFRLRAHNEAGNSPWSAEVQYATLPDRPAAPSKPTVAGRIQAYSFKLRWDAPQHNGGSDVDFYTLELNSGSGYRTVYTGKQAEAVCDKLTPGTTYQLRVCCTTLCGTQSPYSDPCTVTTDAVAPGRCPAPVLAEEPPQPSRICVKWQEPDYNGGAPVLEYETEMMAGPEACKWLTDVEGVETRQDDDIKDKQGGMTTTMLVHKGKERKCKVGGLEPGCEYKFKVRAINRIGRSPWSEELSVMSGAAPPCAPSSPILNVRSSHAISVEWTEPKCNGAPVKEYKLEMNRCGEFEKRFEAIYEGVERSYEVKNLQPATKYDFRVQATNSAGVSDFSEISTAETSASTPSVVSFVRHTATPTAIVVHWNEPGDNGSEIIGYTIEIGDRQIWIDAPATCHAIDSLQCNTQYKIRIQARNAMGDGPFSSHLKVTTAKFPPAPPKLQCVGVGHNYVKLKWGEGKNVDYSQYCVEVLNPRYKEFQCVYKGTAFTCKVNKLQESTAYRFRVNASNDVGVGDYSPEYEFTTCAATPAALRAPKAHVDVDESACLLEWTHAKNPFSVDRLIYVVELSRNNGPFQLVYRGVETKYRVADLDASCVYSARVCPIRLTAEGDLRGPVSPHTSFSIPSNELDQNKIAPNNSNFASTTLFSSSFTSNVDANTVSCSAQTQSSHAPLSSVVNAPFHVLASRIRQKIDAGRKMSERQRVFAYAVLFTAVGVLLAVMSITLYDYK